MRVHTTTNKIRHKIRHVFYNVRKQKTVENLKCANFMSISVTPSIDERVQRLPQQALQKSDTQESPMIHMMYSWHMLDVAQREMERN